jgi:hypothetical protein
MNVFRFLGDMTHLLSIIVRLSKFTQRPHFNYFLVVMHDDSLLIIIHYRSCCSRSTRLSPVRVSVGVRASVPVICGEGRTWFSFRFATDLTSTASLPLPQNPFLSSSIRTGVSLKTQELYLLVFVTRYLDLLYSFISP